MFRINNGKRFIIKARENASVKTSLEFVSKVSDFRPALKTESFHAVLDMPFTQTRFGDRFTYFEKKYLKNNQFTLTCYFHIAKLGQASLAIKHCLLPISTTLLRKYHIQCWQPSIQLTGFCTNEKRGNWKNVSWHPSHSISEGLSLSPLPRTGIRAAIRRSDKVVKIDARCRWDRVISTTDSNTFAVG